MLFSHADVEGAIRENLPEFADPRTRRHGGGDAENFFILCGQFDQGIGKHGGIRRIGFLFQEGPGLNIEGRRAVPDFSLFLGDGVALALARDHMDQCRTFLAFEIFQTFNQQFGVVTVQRTDITESQVLEQASGDEHALDGVIDFVGEMRYIFSHLGNRLQQQVDFPFDFTHDLPGHDLAQVRRHAADVGGNRHFIIVQDDDYVAFEMAGVVQAFKSNARGQRPVTDHRHHFMVFFFEVARFGETDSGGNGGASMAAIPVVVLIFLAFGEPAQTSVLPERMEPVLAPGQQFMDIALVPHVPHKLVARTVKHVMHSQRQFHNPQIGPQMTAGFGYRR